MPHSKNALLARLDVASIERIGVHLRTVILPSGEVISETHQQVQQTYFPHSGIVSRLVVLKSGSAIETGMIGRDGQYGAGQALDDKLSLSRVMVQVPVTASVIDSNRLREATAAIPSLRKLLRSYEQFSFAEAQQTAACNGAHELQARMCKWLLRMHELAGSELPITQEFLAKMMGATRTSVSMVAGEMKRDGVISYARGRLHLMDVDRIREWACECHDAVQLQYQQIFRKI